MGLRGKSAKSRGRVSRNKGDFQRKRKKRTPKKGNKPFEGPSPCRGFTLGRREEKEGDAGGGGLLEKNEKDESYKGRKERSK